MSETILILLGVAAAAMLAAFFPRIGAVARWKRMKTASRRFVLEDVLKHIFHASSKGSFATLKSIAGGTGVTEHTASELMRTLRTMGLATMDGETAILTEEGRLYALRIIRTHRLWERFLADETAVAETEWHERAERQEHLLTDKEAEVLAAQLGYPRYDPHGDPIPTAQGSLPEPRGVPLFHLPAGSSALILHVEDEPSSIYARLAAAGLVPGLAVTVLESKNDVMRLSVEDKTITIDRFDAANITVEEIAERPHPRKKPATLASLRMGETAVVTAISKRCRGQQRRRLMDLGILPGTAVLMEMRSPSGDPTAYRIRGAMIALRKMQADLIYIESPTNAEGEKSRKEHR